jgi:hypothetical protein
MKHFVLKSKNDVDLRMMRYTLGLISLLVLSFAAILLLQGGAGKGLCGDEPRQPRGSSFAYLICPDHVGSRSP